MGKSKAVTFAVGYAPTGPTWEEAKNEFSTALDSAVPQVHNEDHLFVVIGANVRTGKRGGWRSE